MLSTKMAAILTSLCLQSLSLQMSMSDFALLRWHYSEGSFSYALLEFLRLKCSGKQVFHFRNSTYGACIKPDIIQLCSLLSLQVIFSNKSGNTRDYFVYAPNQWETTLQCNVVSHWLAAYTKQSLEWTQTVIYKVPFEVMATSFWCYGSLQRSPSTTQSFYFLQITAKLLNIIVIYWKLKHSQNTLINLLVMGWGIRNIFQWNFIYNWKGSLEKMHM